MVQLCRSRRTGRRGPQGPRHTSQIDSPDICEHRPSVSDGVFRFDGCGETHAGRYPFQESSFRGHDQDIHGEHAGSYGGGRADNKGELFLHDMRSRGPSSDSDRGVMDQAYQRRNDGRVFHGENGEPGMDGGTSPWDRGPGAGQGAQLQGRYIQDVDSGSYYNGGAARRSGEPEIRHGSKAGGWRMGQGDTRDRGNGCEGFQYISTEKLGSAVYISVYGAQGRSGHDGELEAKDRDRRDGAYDQVQILSGSYQRWRGYNKFFFLPFAGEIEPRLKDDVIYYPPTCSTIPPRNPKDLQTLMYCGYSLSEQYAAVYQPFRRLFNWTPAQIDEQPLRRIIDAMEERQEDADIKQRIFGFGGGDGGN